jgi:hypothetical protein
VQIDKIIYAQQPNGDILVTYGTDWHLDITVCEEEKRVKLLLRQT